MNMIDFRQNNQIAVGNIAPVIKMGGKKLIIAITMLLLPLNVFAKTYKGTITIEVGETYYVDVSKGMYITQSGYWKKSNSTFVFRSQGDTSCTICGNKVGTGTLDYWGLVETDTYECYWTVEVVPKREVIVSNIDLNTTSATLLLNETKQLIASIQPSDAADKSVTWSSDKSSVATVSNTGLVTPQSVGTATITCKANDGSGIFSSCTIKVVADYQDGDLFTAELENGIEMTFLVISSAEKTCKVNDGSQNSAAIDKNVKNVQLVIPPVVKGYKVVEIGMMAFYGCDGLISVEIPNSVKLIRKYAFCNCSNLTSLTIGEGVTDIYSTSFVGCIKLLDVYCLAVNVPYTNPDAFEYSNYQNATLHVLAASLNNYKDTEPWKYFKNFVAKCAKPTITYNNSVISFSCETEDAEFVSEIKANDNGKEYGKNIKLSNIYTISVYATKIGYDNSDIVTMEVDGSGIKGDLNGDGKVNAADHVSLSDIIMKQ